MRFLTAFAVFCCLSSALTAQEWKEFKSAEGKFKVILPTEPQKQTIPLKTAVGEVMYNAFISETSGGKVAWGVSYNDYPIEIPKANTEKVLQGGKMGAMRRFNAKVINEIKLQMGNHTGLEFTLEGKMGERDLIYHSRIFLVGSRMYQLQVIQVDGEPVDVSDTFRFLGSFQLSDGTEETKPNKPNGNTPAGKIPSGGGGT